MSLLNACQSDPWSQRHIWFELVPSLLQSEMFAQGIPVSLLM